MAEAGERLAAVAAGPGPDCQHWDWRTGAAPAVLGGRWIVAWGGDYPGAPFGFSMAPGDVHDWWRGADPRTRHPLAPLVDAWQRLAPVPAEWDARQWRNVPAPVVGTRHVWDSHPAAPPADQPRFEVAYLPTLDPDADSRLPLAMLDLFTAAASRGSGGPVPVPARIGWEVVLALDSAARIGGPARLDCTLADLHRRVYPATPRWQKRHGPAMVRGLFNLDAARVRWRGDATGGLYPLVEVYRLPTQPLPAERAVFLSHLSPGSQQGPQADSELLRRLAVASARQHRMMLSAYCLWDRYGTVNGRLIAPTRPQVVRRDGAVYVVDAAGKVVTDRGAPTRRATHRRAVQTGAREANPEADRYPWLADRKAHDRRGVRGRRLRWPCCGCCSLPRETRCRRWRPTGGACPETTIGRCRCPRWTARYRPCRHADRPGALAAPTWRRGCCRAGGPPGAGAGRRRRGCPGASARLDRG